MTMGRLFGTDGVRGVANVPPMTAETVLQIGRATAYVCRQVAPDRRPRVLIGKDTRLSGYMLETALTAGICSMGVDVLLVGPMPTAGIAFLTRNMRADAGVVISASHNPYQDNGIKIFSRTGYKLPDEEEQAIERLVMSGEIEHVRPTADAVGRANRIDDAVGRYVVFCKNTFPEECSIEGLRIVIDCAHGAAYRVAPTIFAELGADVVAIHCRPNGRNINAGCGAVHPERMRATVLREKADVGLAFDGDADRLVVVDERGGLLTGDHLLAILATAYQAQGRLQQDLVVATPMSNIGLRRALAERGIRLVEAAVGDRHVLETMLATGAVLGGESSGHVICHDLHTTGDGIVTALQLLAAAQTQSRSISELASIVQMAPQQLRNVPVRKTPPLEEVTALQQAVARAERELGDAGRVLIRYSGTQALCRIMVEGPSEAVVERLVSELAAVVEAQLG